MSYYPLLKAPGCESWTTLCNFSPNNWEYTANTRKIVNVTWTEDSNWISRKIGELEANAIRTIKANELEDIVPSDSIVLLSLTDEPLTDVSNTLPQVKSPTVMPAWRSSLGLSTTSTSTSYQGEIDPFPSPGSLLSFCPFLQVGEGVCNYLVLMNIEKEATKRNAIVEIYDAADKVLKGEFRISNNAINVISLDGLEFERDDLVLNICREMGAIPLYLSLTADGTYISLEHTHPPASLAIHGNRWGVQKVLKNFWFEKMARS